MTAFGYFLLWVGCIVMFVADIRFLVVTYRHSVPWFLVCLFLPPAGLIFFLLHVKETWRPVALYFVGLVVVGIGCWIGEISIPT